MPICTPSRPKCVERTCSPLHERFSPAGRSSLEFPGAKKRTLPNCIACHYAHNATELESQKVAGTIRLLAGEMTAKEPGRIVRVRSAALAKYGHAASRNWLLPSCAPHPSVMWLAPCGCPASAWVSACLSPSDRRLVRSDGAIGWHHSPLAPSAQGASHLLHAMQALRKVPPTICSCSGGSFLPGATCRTCEEGHVASS